MMLHQTKPICSIKEKIACCCAATTKSGKAKLVMLAPSSSNLRGKSSPSLLKKVVVKHLHLSAEPLYPAKKAKNNNSEEEEFGGIDMDVDKGNGPADGPDKGEERTDERTSKKVDEEASRKDIEEEQEVEARASGADAEEDESEDEGEEAEKAKEEKKEENASEEEGEDNNEDSEDERKGGPSGFLDLEVEESSVHVSDKEKKDEAEKEDEEEPVDKSDWTIIEEDNHEEVGALAEPPKEKVAQTTPAALSGVTPLACPVARSDENKVQEVPRLSVPDEIKNKPHRHGSKKLGMQLGFPNPVCQACCKCKVLCKENSREARNICEACNRHQWKCHIASEEDCAMYNYEALVAAFAQAQQRGTHIVNPYGPDGKDVDQSWTVIAAAMMGMAVQKLQVTMESIEKALWLRQCQAAQVAEIQKVQVAVLSCRLGILVQEFNGWLVDTECQVEAAAPLDDKDLEYLDFGFTEDGPDVGAPADGTREEEDDQEGQDDEEDRGMRLVDEVDLVALMAGLGEAGLGPSSFISCCCL
ncbi:hypothetical protein NP233_g3349 [Leucocoprinus birnbaumii]|uniref:Uncharacterized protein n=1 Tax=Leucocoprinus birnbaumii TaxID=56174 RepID=A0AAD5YTY4_9AGAR|nr:hypothetical protein NP233_g3349 [Leucocoprinus birnbaumii]